MKEKSFELAIKELEKIIQELESGEVDLDNSINKYSEAMKLIDFCEEYIKLKIMARVVEGKANKAIIEYLSQILGYSKSKIQIVNGEKSSIKTIQINH